MGRGMAIPLNKHAAGTGGWAPGSRRNPIPNLDARPGDSSPLQNAMAPQLDFTDPTTVGWTFITASVVLFLLEATAPGFFVAVPATILMLLGLLAFVAPDIALSPVYAPIIVVVVGVPATLATIYLYRRMAPPEVSQVTTSSDLLTGRTGVVTRVVEPGNSRGKVRIGRQIWSATADTPIPEGTSIVVVDARGVILTVTPEPVTPATGA